MLDSLSPEFFTKLDWIKARQGLRITVQAGPSVHHLPGSFTPLGILILAI